MLREKYGAGSESPGKEGAPAADHPLETIGRKPYHDFHKRPLGKMINDYHDAVKGGAGDGIEHHKNKIKSYIDDMSKEAVQHNKDWINGKIDDKDGSGPSKHHWEISDHLNKRGATYDSVKDFHDKHGNEETKKLFKYFSHSGQYTAEHTKPEDWKDHKGIADSIDKWEAEGELWKYHDKDHPKRREHDRRYAQSEKDYKEHGYASPDFWDNYENDPEVERKAQDQYDRYKDLNGEEMWEGFKHEHGIKE
jgi:hypothetical protein